MTEPGTDERRDHEEETEVRLPYQPPRLTRWGRLTELTFGAPGRKHEPSKRRTRL